MVKSHNNNTNNEIPVNTNDRDCNSCSKYNKALMTIKSLSAEVSRLKVKCNSLLEVVNENKKKQESFKKIPKTLNPYKVKLIEKYSEMGYSLRKIQETILIDDHLSVSLGVISKYVKLYKERKNNK